MDKFYIKYMCHHFNRWQIETNEQIKQAHLKTFGHYKELYKMSKRVEQIAVK